MRFIYFIVRYRRYAAKTMKTHLKRVFVFPTTNTRTDGRCLRFSPSRSAKVIKTILARDDDDNISRDIRRRRSARTRFRVYTDETATVRTTRGRSRPVLVCPPRVRAISAVVRVRKEKRGLRINRTHAFHAFRPSARA